MSGATPSGISSATMNYGCEHSSAWCSKAPTTQTWPGTQATQLVPVNVITTSQQSPTTANTEPFTRSGFSLLDMAGNLLNDDNKPTSLSLSWNIESLTPVGTPVGLPLSAVVNVGAVG